MLLKPLPLLLCLVAISALAGCGGASTSGPASDATTTAMASSGMSAASAPPPTTTAATTAMPMTGSTAMVGSPTMAGSSTGMDMSGVSTSRPCDGYGTKAIGMYRSLVAIEARSTILPAAQAAASSDPMTHVLVAGTGVKNDLSANKHLEVFLCDASSGAPAQHLTPTVTLQDLTSGTGAVAVPLAEVYVRGDNPANVHYGNNVAFPSGHQAQVTVTVAGDTAQFKVVVE